MPNKMVNINQLYERCLSGQPKDIITARTVYDYCISPFMVYCGKFGPEEKKDPMDEYNKLLFEQGKAHEKQVIENNYPGLKQVTYATLKEGFKLLLQEMTEGVSVACGLPVFYMPEGLTGIIDVIERRQGHKTIFGNYYYIIKEIKLAKNIQKHHIYQAAFYNYVLGKIQGYTPNSFYMINRDLEQIEQIYDEAEFLAMLNDIREILKGKRVNPTYDACKWPWETYNNEEAIKTRDVSLVSGVGPSFKKRLTAQNILTVEHLAKTRMQHLTAMKGIGEKTATKFLNNAIDYLIGLLVRSSGKETYIPFIAHKFNQEKQMFSNFVDWVLSQQDYVVYHWHNYERTHIQRLVERYGLSTEAEPILANMRDLYKDATSNFAFPTYGNGLKEIAAYIGYKWKHADVNAMESIALYFQYVQNPAENKDKLEKVIDYNKDDCMATLLIKDWLEHESNK